jgi:phosphoglycerate dehydrogenase-like enzyme
VKPKILVTDSLFIFDEHVQKLEAAGFEVERINKVTPTTDEMIAGLAGKQGYICGGLEKISTDVLKTATQLRAISVLASGYTEFLPCHKEATKMGIAVAACPGANQQAVAEYALLMMLASLRNFKSLTTPGGSTFYTARELPSLTLGIIGFGYIGQTFAKIALVLGMKVIANSRHKETIPGVELVDLETLLRTSDVVSLHVNKIHGTGVLGKHELELMKPGCILINCTFKEAIDTEPLRAVLLAGKIKLATDDKLNFKTADLPMDALISSNEGTAFNTHETLKRMSDRATSSMISLLKTGDDTDLVNPEYRKYRP